MPKAILFDLDDTLTDRRPSVAPQWQIATLGEIVDLVHSDGSTSSDCTL